MTAKEQLIITDNSLEEYRKILQNEEKKASTIEKYIRDVKKLRDFAKGQPITQELLINYKLCSPQTYIPHQASTHT